MKKGVSRQTISVCSCAHPALDLRTSHCFCCSPSSSEMEKVCSGSILCNTGVNRLMTDSLSPLQLVATQSPCEGCHKTQSAPHPDFSVRYVVLPEPWPVKGHEVLIGAILNSLNTTRVAGHHPRVVQPRWGRRGGEGEMGRRGEEGRGGEEFVRGVAASGVAKLTTPSLLPLPHPPVTRVPTTRDCGMSSGRSRH